MCNCNQVNIYPENCATILMSFMQKWGLLCPYCDGDDFAAYLRPGNVHSANGTFNLIKPTIIGHCKKFKLLWLWGQEDKSDETFIFQVC